MEGVRPMYYTVRCDIAPGKQDEMDQLMEQMKAFWMAQPGVKGFHVYNDMMEGWPERTVMVELEDMACLQRVLDAPERKQFRKQFMDMAVSVQSQMMHMMM
jgi:quinol monooxygenase YgiN